MVFEGKQSTIAQVQHKYYGEIHSIAILMSPERLFKRAVSASYAMGWDVVAIAPDEGRSAIGISLARAAARMGKKVVIIDCDPAQTTRRAMHVPDHGGIYDVLSGAMPLNRVLTRDSRTDAVVLAMTRQPPNMVTMFGSEQMKKLIKLLRENCDMVVVDCARASAPETWLLARMSDATLMVSRRGVLNTPILARSLEILTAAKVAPLGLIVTR